MQRPRVAEAHQAGFACSASRFLELHPIWVVSLASALALQPRGAVSVLGWGDWAGANALASAKGNVKGPMLPARSRHGLDEDDEAGPGDPGPHAEDAGGAR